MLEMSVSRLRFEVGGRELTGSGSVPTRAGEV